MPRQTPDECPFCVGHEDRTPPASLVVPATDGRWQVRVVPNRFPALTPPAGLQEVVIHSPDHRLGLSDLTADELRQVAGAWAERARVLAGRGFPHVFASVNDGPGSGASLDHTHSQLTALPAPAPLMALRQAQFADPGTCPLCREVEAAAADARRVVAEASGLVAYVPEASAAAFQLRVAPRRHRPDALAEPALVAEALGLVAQAYTRALAAPPWNAWLASAPLTAATPFHWHVEAWPRLTVPAAIELGAGLPICPVAPECAAATLRA